MYLAIDYGKKRVGLAVGSQFPRGIGVINNPGSFSELAEKIKQLCADYDVESVIMGMPKLKSRDRSELSKEIEQLSEKIELITGVKVIFEEESYTSVSAEEELKKRGIDVRKNKEKVDELAAILILEQYIGSS